jgi:hypothetical protein
MILAQQASAAPFEGLSTLPSLQRELPIVAQLLGKLPGVSQIKAMLPKDSSVGLEDTFESLTSSIESIEKAMPMPSLSKRDDETVILGAALLRAALGQIQSGLAGLSSLPGNLSKSSGKSSMAFQPLMPSPGESLPSSDSKSSTPSKPVFDSIGAKPSALSTPVLGSTSKLEHSKGLKHLKHSKHSKHYKSSKHANGARGSKDSNDSSSSIPSIPAIGSSSQVPSLNVIPGMSMLTSALPRLANIL